MSLFNRPNLERDGFLGGLAARTRGPVRIERRPELAHEIVAYLRARGWRYDAGDRLPWLRGPVAIATAREALALELGEHRMELR